MQYSIYLLISLFFISMMVSSQQLESYQWKNRVVVFIAEKGSTDLEKQKNKFVGFEREIVERDMIFINRKPNNQELTSRYRIKEDFEGVVLIGKDGGIKLSKPFLVKPQTLFDLIDSMPMRRAEMRN